MESGLLETLINLGGLGVAVGVLVVFGREIFRRMNETSRWTEQLAEGAISAMQQITRDSIESQRKLAETLSNLCREMEQARKDRSEEHREILDATKKLTGRLGRRADAPLD